MTYSRKFQYIKITVSSSRLNSARYEVMPSIALALDFNTTTPISLTDLIDIQFQITGRSLAIFNLGGVVAEKSSTDPS